MTYPANVVKVMIASPGDVVKERGIIREVIAEWNVVHSEDKGIVLLPVGWETHATPDMGDRPQEIINKQVLKDCDVLVGVFKHRIGSDTGKSISGSVEEIEEHIATGKPTMLYFSTEDVPRNHDASQLQAVKDFEKSLQGKGLYANYDNADDFKAKFQRHLAQKLIQSVWSFEVTDIESGVVLGAVFDSEGEPALELSEKARMILEESTLEGGSGHVMMMDHGEAFFVSTNSKDLVENKDPRSRAEWKESMAELCTEGLLEEQGYKGEQFEVTAKGWRFGGSLRGEQSDAAVAVEQTGKSAVLNNEKAMEALSTAAQANSGTVFVRSYANGWSIQTGGKKYGENTKGRLQAEWVEALQVLEAEGLLEDQTGEGKRFEVTGKGYAFVEELQ